MRLGKKWDIMGFHGSSMRITVISWIIKENWVGSHESDESRRNSTRSALIYPSVNHFSFTLTGSFSFCSADRLESATPKGRRGYGNSWAVIGRRVGRSAKREKCQTVCKPGSVLGPEADGWPFLWDARCRTPRATNPDGRRKLPLRPPGCPDAAPVPIRSCSRWGLPCRDRRRPRGALLPHPFTLARGPSPAVRAVCFLWHFPWGRPRRALPGTVFPWSPDFPPPAPPKRGRERPSDRLADVKIGVGSAVRKARARRRRRAKGRLIHLTLPFAGSQNDVSVRIRQGAGMAKSAVQAAQIELGPEIDSDAGSPG